ncbi:MULTISPECIES: PDDEXK family nuclease [Stutzerimonas stutzeri group]|jgi:hypothetical protein|uniref:hypothetical protein n=1 Tax=Stutzerimonas frequens TaxID=2968969 RepID=UPI0026CEC2D6
MTITEHQIEQDLLAKLGDLKYSYRPEIRDCAGLEANFREKFQQLNRVNLTDEEFARLLEEMAVAGAECNTGYCSCCYLLRGNGITACRVLSALDHAHGNQ